MNVKAPEQRKGKPLTIRFTAAQRQALEKEAERRNVNTADVVRELLFAQPFMQEVKK